MFFNDSTSSWVLKDGVIRVFDQHKQLSYKHFSTYDSLSLNTSPQSILRSKNKVEELTLNEHYRFLKMRQSTAFSGTDEIEVKLHEKIAFPFACFIVFFIAVPLAAQRLKVGLAFGTGITIAIGFIYFILQKSFSTLGYNGAISVYLATWLPNAFFLSSVYSY